MRSRFGDPLHIDRRRAWNLYRQRLRRDSLDRPAFEAALDRFLHTRSEADAESLGLTRPLPPDPRSLTVIDRAPSTQSLARLANDISPASGSDAPDRVLGPWSDVLDPRRDADRQALLVAMAAACFVPVDEDRWGRAPFAQWVRRQPHPAVEDRERFRAVGRAAAAAWRRVGDRLEPLLPIATGAVPDGPVHLPLLASVQGVTGDLVLARVLPTETGWVAPIALALPEIPPDLGAWARQEAWLYQVDHKLASLDDLLRDRPHLLWRRVHEWAFSRA